MIESIVVALIVITALAFWVRRIFRTAQGTGGDCGCGKGSCSTAPAPKGSLLEIQPPDSP